MTSHLSPTGIQGLDAQFGGGLPSGSVVLALSEPNNAPYLFCEQFAGAGLNQKEIVYYYSMERPKPEVLGRIRQHLTHPEAIKNLQFFDLYSIKMRDLSAAQQRQLGIENHAVNLTEDLVARLLHHPKDTPFRVIVESLTESIQAYGLEPNVRMLTGLDGIVRAMGGIALVVAIRGILDQNQETRLRHLADGVIEFGVERQGFGLYSYLSITKMRGVQDAVRLLLYKETDQGLWLESTRRVF